MAQRHTNEHGVKTLSQRPSYRLTLLLAAAGLALGALIAWATV